jgi:hypothetical protein
MESQLVVRDRLYMITLTAPGEKVHYLPGGRVRCRCTPAGGIDLRVWNGRAPKQFNRFKQQFQRELGVTIEHFRATEAQERGALHYHCPMRFSAPRVVSKAMVRRIAMAYGFGHSVDIQEIGFKGPAGYCGKYVSKSADDRQRVPYMHPVTGEVGPGRWRTWSSSRRWGQSMSAVKCDQRAWIAARLAEAQRGGAADPGAAAGAFNNNHASYTSEVDALPFKVSQ